MIKSRPDWDLLCFIILVYIWMAFCLGLDQMKGNILQKGSRCYANQIKPSMKGVCMDVFFVCIFCRDAKQCDENMGGSSTFPKS